MLNGKEEEFSGFLVHAYPDHRKNRLYFLGRMEDGRSFAAIEENWRPYIHIYERDLSRAIPFLDAFDFENTPSALESFSGSEKLLRLEFSSFSGRSRAAASLQDASIPTPDGDINPADLFLTEKQIRGSVLISGYARPGKKVDVVIRKAQISSLRQTVTSPLKIASVDIETDVVSGLIRAVGIAWTTAADNTIADNAIQGKVRVLAPVTDSHESVKNSPLLIIHHDEKSMLAAFIEDIRMIDPDVLTGWNFIDFDFPYLAQRYQKLKLPFTLGRSEDNAKFFPGEDSGGSYWRRRSAAAVVPGRQVLDALRVMRAGSASRTVGQGFSLEEVSIRVLGEKDR